jgi:hypothetical protein
MSGVVVIDTNLMVLLVVGTASRNYIAKHKRLKDYTTYHFDCLCAAIGPYSEMVLLPHILTEVSNLTRQGAHGEVAFSVQAALRNFIETNFEFPIDSKRGVQRDEFYALGLTDAVILNFCAMNENGIYPTLLTVDEDLANRASSMGYSVKGYDQIF